MVQVADSGIRLVLAEVLIDVLYNCQDNSCEMVALPFINCPCGGPWEANGGECRLYNVMISDFYSIYSD